MPRIRKPQNSTARRRQLVLKMGMASLSKRDCSQCVEAGRLCHSGEGSDRCVECVKGGIDCELSPINVPKWKRMEEQRVRLRTEEDEAFAKLSRLRKQIQKIESEQRKMVEKEVKNIEALEKEEEEASARASSPRISVPGSPFVGGPSFEPVDWETFAASSGFVFESPAASQGN